MEEMRAAGITRILNLATECGADDWGLKLGQRFQYRKIGMRDTVEEDGVTGGVREACEVLGAHSVPLPLIPPSPPTPTLLLLSTGVRKEC